MKDLSVLTWFLTKLGTIRSPNTPWIDVVDLEELKEFRDVLLGIATRQRFQSDTAFHAQLEKFLGEFDEKIARKDSEIASLVERVKAPIPMLLWCPSCGERHLDEGELATTPHRTHACQSCGVLWAPAVVPTVGVQFLPGCKNDKPSAKDDQPTIDLADSDFGEVGRAPRCEKWIREPKLQIVYRCSLPEGHDEIPGREDHRYGCEPGMHLGVCQDLDGSGSCKGCGAWLGWLEERTR